MIVMCVVTVLLLHDSLVVLLKAYHVWSCHLSHANHTIRACSVPATRVPWWKYRAKHNRPQHPFTEMASKKEVTVSREVYSKIALHLTKYYYTPVLGYLIGSGNQTVSPPPPPRLPVGPVLISWLPSGQCG